MTLLTLPPAPHRTPRRTSLRSPALLTALAAAPVLSFTVAGCSSLSPHPQPGGGATTTLGGVNAPTTVTSSAPANPQTPSTTTVEKSTTREFTPRDFSAPDLLAGQRIAETGGPALSAPYNPNRPGSSSATAAPANPLTISSGGALTSPAPVSPLLLRETVVERATTQTGITQKDTARDLGVRLTNMRGVMWAGVLLLIGGPLLGWRLGWLLNGAIAGAAGLLLILLAQILPGHEAWFGLAALLLIPVVAFVYYRAHHDATTGERKAEG